MFTLRLLQILKIVQEKHQLENPKQLHRLRFVRLEELTNILCWFDIERQMLAHFPDLSYIN